MLAPKQQSVRTLSAFEVDFETTNEDAIITVTASWRGFSASARSNELGITDISLEVIALMRLNNELRLLWEDLSTLIQHHPFPRESALMFSPYMPGDRVEVIRDITAADLGEGGDVVVIPAGKQARVENRQSHLIDNTLDALISISVFSDPPTQPFIVRTDWLKPVATTYPRPN